MMNYTTTGLEATSMNLRQRLERLLRESSYVLGSLPLALVSSMVSINLFLFGVSVLIVVIGVPILTFSLLAAGKFASVERRLANLATGRYLLEPHYLQAAPDAGWRAALALVTLPWMISPLANLQAAVSQALLSTRGVYEAQIDDLRSSRAAAREAEAHSLHRLERDIHDGPQQRLVRLQMDLARAERAAATDPERARTLLAEARKQTADTLGKH